MGYAAAMRRLVWCLALAGCAPRLDDAEVAALVTDGAGRDGVFGVIGDARIVGFGVPVAGASEGLDEALLRGLVTERGFVGLALDADATAARALDAYVGGGDGDVDAALLGLGDPSLATAELRRVMVWLREHNTKASPRVRVFGLDPRDGDAAAAVVLEYLNRVDPAYVPTARSMFASGEQLAVDQVLARLDERREVYAGDDVAAWVDARLQAEVAAQARRMAETWEFEAGEFARARNAELALSQLAGGRLIILASNRRVAAEMPGAVPSMGNFLRTWLGDEYRALAASYAGGRVRGDACETTDVKAAPGSLDAALAAAKQARALVDLRGRGGALKQPQRLGDETLRPAVAFDGIWTIGQVSPTTPLRGCPGNGR